MIGRKRNLVCIDLCSDRIAALEVRDGKVHGWFFQMLPPGLVRGGDPVSPEELGAHLRQILAVNGIDSTEARLTLASEAVVTRVLQLPRMPRRHLPKAVAFAAERELPIPLERAAWDWAVIQSDAAGTRVRVTAAWADIVDRTALAARLAGLQLRLLEPRPVALRRAIGLDSALVIEGVGRTIETCLLADNGPPVTDQTQLTDGEARPTAVQRLVDRALRRQSMARGGDRNAPVILAGDLELDMAPVGPAMLVASQLINGHGPTRPAGMPLGLLLPALGLAMAD